MTRRGLLLLLVLALVLAPGCELVSIPLKILDGITSALFFWANADAAGDVPLVPPGEALADAAPIPLTEALESAIALDATGPAWLVPEGGPVPAAVSAPPRPGAVLVAVRVVEDEVPAGLRDRLADRGLRLARPPQR